MAALCRTCCSSSRSALSILQTAPYIASVCRVQLRISAEGVIRVPAASRSLFASDLLSTSETAVWLQLAFFPVERGICVAW